MYSVPLVDIILEFQVHFSFPGVSEIYTPQGRFKASIQYLQTLVILHVIKSEP